MFEYDFSFAVIPSLPINPSKPKCLEVLPDGQQRALHYRYKISPKDSVNAFKPRELEASLDRNALRPAQFGAIYHRRYSQLPQCEWCRVVWEA